MLQNIVAQIDCVACCKLCIFKPHFSAMPINRLALIRYKTIDQCLQNRFRKWTLEDLMEACSEALYEYEGISKGIGRRTIQLDIQNMRSEKLGYNAPIIVIDKKFYTYEDKDFSITNSPLNVQDLTTLNEVVLLLKQFKGFGFFHELDNMVTRLEDKLYKQNHKGKSYIDFEKNELLKGLEHIDPLLKCLNQEMAIEVVYQSFKAENAQTFVFYPYLLKEYRNRWFLLGAKKVGKAILILALDRLESFNPLPYELFYDAPFDVSSYFNDVIGVSKAPNQIPSTIVLKVANDNVPYVLTKPLHPSQKLEKTLEDGSIFSINVIWNFELEREILGFGDAIKVLSPKRLSGKIQGRMKKALHAYQNGSSDRIQKNE